MRILEINYLPFLKERFPDETEYIDTRFTFAGVVGVVAKLRQTARQFMRLLHFTLGSRFDFVFCRCLGRFIYRHEAPLLVNVLRLAMGWCILLCVWAQVRRGARLAVMDRTDESSIDPRDLFLLERCERYFKRELPQNAWHALVRFQPRHRELFDVSRLPRFRPHIHKLVPLSLGIAPDKQRQIEETLAHLPRTDEKRYDVFFGGDVKHSTVRIDGLRQLEALRARGCRVEIQVEHVPYEEFVEKMHAAWLVWSPEGSGWDCYRHYEVPMAGSVPLINHPTIHRHAPLLGGVHCVQYGVEGDDLCRQVEAALEDKERLRQMAAAARAHVLEHHTHAALGGHLLSQLTQQAASLPATFPSSSTLPPAPV